ncbi:MAG TPA: hypothetical protein VFS43_24730 [Polyangiaceae bacterium]|nr:hypothetical protein [Polyangiaceae bacterium]
MSSHALSSAPPVAAGRRARRASAPIGAVRRRARRAPAPRRPTFALLATLAASAALAGSGCSLAVGGFVEGCSTDADCKTKGERFAGSVCRDGACRPTETAAKGEDWSCLERPGGEGAEPPEQVRVAFRFVDLASAAPVTGVSLVACASADLLCSQPLAPAIRGDDNGRIEAQVPTASAVGTIGFGGYFRAEAPERDTLLLLFHPPLVEDVEELVAMGRAGQLFENAPVLGITLEPDRAGAVLLARDCRGEPSPGVTFELEGGDPAARIFYGVGPVPSPSAVQTDDLGLAIGLNLPAGVLTFRMAHPERGELARFLLRTSRDQVSTAIVRPGR